MKRGFIILFAGIVFVGCGFLAGYLAGSYIFHEDEPEPAQVDPIDQTAITQNEEEEINDVLSNHIEQSPEPTYYGVQYLVILEDNHLCFYEVNGQTKKQIKSTEITRDMYPDNDIKELETGIYTGTLEGGLEILENFTS